MDPRGRLRPSYRQIGAETTGFVVAVLAILGGLALGWALLDALF